MVCFQSCCWPTRVYDELRTLIKGRRGDMNCPADRSDLSWPVDSQAWRNVRDKLDQFPEMVRPYFSPPGSDCSGLEGSKWVHRQSSKLYTSMGHNAPIRMVYFSDSTHPREEKKHTNRAMYTDSRFVYYIQFYSIISPYIPIISPFFTASNYCIRRSP